jgi:hypothetical protein
MANLLTSMDITNTKYKQRLLLDKVIISLFSLREYTKVWNLVEIYPKEIIDKICLLILPSDGCCSDIKCIITWNRLVIHVFINYDDILFHCFGTKKKGACHAIDWIEDGYECSKCDDTSCLYCKKCTRPQEWWNHTERHCFDCCFLEDSSDELSESSSEEELPATKFIRCCYPSKQLYLKSLRFNIDTFFVKCWKQDWLFNYQIFSKFSEIFYIPKEIIFLINFWYIECRKSTLFSINDIRCPCIEPMCIQKWYTHLFDLDGQVYFFDHDYRGIDLLSPMDIFHCDVTNEDGKKCHHIRGIEWNSLKCNYCVKLRCYECTFVTLEDECLCLDCYRLWKKEDSPEYFLVTQRNLDDVTKTILTSEL